MNFQQAKKKTSAVGLRCLSIVVLMSSLCFLFRVVISNFRISRTLRIFSIEPDIELHDE